MSVLYKFKLGDLEFTAYFDKICKKVKFMLISYEINLLSELWKIRIVSIQNVFDRHVLSSEL